MSSVLAVLPGSVSDAFRVVSAPGTGIAVMRCFDPACVRADSSASPGSVQDGRADTSERERGSDGLDRCLVGLSDHFLPGGARHSCSVGHGPSSWLARSIDVRIVRDPSRQRKGRDVAAHPRCSAVIQINLLSEHGGTCVRCASWLI